MTRALQTEFGRSEALKGELLKIERQVRHRTYFLLLWDGANIVTSSTLDPALHEEIHAVLENRIPEVLARSGCKP